MAEFDASGKAGSEAFARTPLLIAESNCSCVMKFDFLMRGFMVSWDEIWENFLSKVTIELFRVVRNLRLDCLHSLRHLAVCYFTS